jgi:multidrug efflux pump subunit AcrB
MWIVKAALKNPYAVAVLAMMIVVLGVISVVSIPIDILPVFKAPAVQVLTYYPGMPASSIEKTITNRIERWVNQAPGVRRIESKSVPGVSVVKLYFRDDIDPNSALTLATSLAQGTLATLPPNTLPPVVFPFDPTGTIPLGILTVNNKNLDEAMIKDWARIQVRNDIGAIKGAVAPVVVGGKDRTILAYLNPRDMWTRKVSPTDVVNALRDGNLMVTPGTAYFGPYQLLLDSNVMVNKVEELNGLPIRMEPGENVYLRDIGEVEDTYAIQTSRVRIDGKSQVFVPVYRQGGASSLAVSSGVKKDLKRMESRLPPGTKLQYVMDQSGYVWEAILSLIHEGIFGAALVSIMILLFLGNVRMTMIAVMSIPLAILCSIIGLNFTGNTINAMTLGGLALAIGPLVDDAIVVLENTHRHHGLGKSKIKAAFDGAVEVTIPVLVATSTTIIVLCPIAFMPGMGGFLFRPLTLAVAFAMIASFLLSRTFVPVLCAKWLGEHTHPGAEHASPGLGQRIFHRIERGLGFLTRQYERLLAAALRHRLAVLAVIGLLFAGSLGLFFGIGQEFFPQVDAGQITMYVRNPSRFNLKATTEKIARLEKFLETFIPPGEREMILSELGLDPDWSAAYTANSGQQDTVVRIQLNDKRTLSAQEYAVKLRHLLHDAGVSWRRFVGKQDQATRLKLLWAFHKDEGDPVVGRLGYATLFKELFQKPLTEARLRHVLAALDKPESAQDRRLRELLRSRSFDRLLNNPRLGDLNISFDTGGMVSTALNNGASSPIDIQIEGGVQADAMKLARKIRAEVKKVPGAADVRILQRLDAPYLKLNVDREKANEVGLTAADVIKQVVAAMNSSVSLNRNFWIDSETNNQYFVGVQYREDPNRRIEDILDGIYATSTKQYKQVALSSLLIQPLDRTTKEAVEINHVSLARVFNVLVNTEGRDIGGVAADVQEKLAQVPTPPGVNVQLRGEYARMQRSFQSLGSGLLMASVLVYLLLVALFRSWLGPFIIMFTVPLGLIGVLTILFVTHTTLNVQSEMGVIFLVGIVVSNGVLLVDFANKQRKLGASVHKAITTAAAIRFRPILMTFLATFLDLIPMAIGLGRGSEANVPLARAVVGGLLTSTFLTLVVVPILFTLLIRDRAEPEIDIDKELADPAAAPSPIAAAVEAADTGITAPRTSHPWPSWPEQGPEAPSGP